MRTKDENIQLADLLFPNVKESVEDVFKKYPKRELKDGAEVLRFAPSPTGFLHIGSVYSGLVCTKISEQTDGVAILRIEDTDKKREVKEGVQLIVEGLKGFGIEFNEGPGIKGDSIGDYAPYMQSKRLDIYKGYVDELIEKYLAIRAAPKL